MTDKIKAAQESSPKTSHGNNSTHLAQLEWMVVEQLHHIAAPWPFEKAQCFMTAQGFTRDEIVTTINKLVNEGALKYVRRTWRQVEPWPRVELHIAMDGGDE